MVKDLLGAGKITAELIKALQKTGTGIARPWQIRRVGKAKTDVEIDRTLRIADAKKSALQIAKSAKVGSLSVEDQALLERTITTKFNEFMREQQNREKIVDRSLQLASDKKDSSRSVNEDWLLRFMKYASEISDENIQEFWAKILVNEAVDKQPRATLKSIDALRFFDSFFCELFRVCANCYACFGFIFLEFIEYHLDVDDVSYRRCMKILESFGVVNPYQLSAEVDLLQRYEFLYFGEGEELGVSRLSNIDSPVYLLSPIGINLAEIIFNLTFYEERWPSKKVASYIAGLEQLVPSSVRAQCLWGFIQDNLIAKYGNTLSIAVVGVGGYVSLRSKIEDDEVTYAVEFANKAQQAKLKTSAPELFLIAESIRKNATGRLLYSESVEQMQ